MKIHLTIPTPTGPVAHKALIPTEGCYGLKINDKIDVQVTPVVAELVPGPGYMVIRGMSGIDGMPTRHDATGIVPRRLWDRRRGKLIRFRPNRVDSRIGILDCIYVPKKSVPVTP